MGPHLQCLMAVFHKRLFLDEHEFEVKMCLVSTPHLRRVLWYPHQSMQQGPKFMSCNKKSTILSKFDDQYSFIIQHQKFIWNESTDRFNSDCSEGVHYCSVSTTWAIAPAASGFGFAERLLFRIFRRSLQCQDFAHMRKSSRRMVLKFLGNILANTECSGSVSLWFSCGYCNFTELSHNI